MRQEDHTDVQYINFQVPNASVAHAACGSEFRRPTIRYPFRGQKVFLVAEVKSWHLQNLPKGVGKTNQSTFVCRLLH